MKSRRTLIVAFALATGLSAATAQAQVAAAAAEALFSEGRALMERGDYPAACAKFAESERLAPSSGTTLNLARCYGLQGKTASAWAKYLEAGRIAREQGRAARAAEAKKKAAELEPDLSYLTIVAPQLPADASVELDNVRLEPTSFGSKLPVDPGPHFLTVRAPGYDDKRIDIAIGAKRDTQTLTIPTLTLTPAPVPPAPAPEPPAPVAPTPPVAPAPPPQPVAEAPIAAGQGEVSRDAGSGEASSALPYVIGGAGLVALGVGATFGALALSSYKDADAACPTHRDCTDDAMKSRDTADTQGWIANVGVGLGVVGLGVATILLVSSGGDESPAKAAQRRLGIRRTGFEPLVGRDALGLSFRSEL
jgi:hypothetical protein